MRYSKDGKKKTGYVSGNFENQFLSSWDLMQLIKYNNAKI